ncbi:hypothetical protein [Polyangium sp. 15x6]|uniref:hypothetical protein n=1 Tax=Polyangium sp. 15x6 TaxID=3042687 RepID=UPI00249AB0EF|nr:hypothetical protein [Polyangium sp. 15x6]MDI3292093.1 hypothetical protein [Polyangium sp. 15x6]
MRARHVIALITIFAVASCRQTFGIEEAAVLCPPDDPACKYCDTPNDCGPAGECHSWTCEENSCRPVNAPARTKCSTGVCSDDAVSECVACVAYEDCPHGHCKDHVCSRCDDGIQNGYESGVDCGGGGACKRCLGSACSTDDECKSGICAEGTCCNTPCDEVCVSCSIAPGNCSPLPAEFADTSGDPPCAGNNACNGAGACQTATGAFCTSNVECISGRCVTNRCVKPQGEPCTQPEQCADFSCVDGVCTK